MNTAFKVLTVILLLIFWIFFSHWIYSPCYDCAQTEQREPLLFKWNEPTAIVNAKFEELKTTTVTTCAKNEWLDITGYYFADELNNTNFENLGLARAAAVSALLVPTIPQERVRLKAVVARYPDDSNKRPQQLLFEAIAFECVESAALYSEYSDATIKQGFTFDAYYRDILTTGTSEQQLEIVGLYYEEEKNSTTFANLGLARASAAKALFAKDLSTEQIVLTSRKIPSPSVQIPADFPSIAINWKEGTRTLEQLEDRVLIRFPYSSVQKDFDPVVDEYLDQLATRLKSSGETVELTGHSDNVGSADANEKLAMRRAKMIRDILRDKGVKRNQIVTLSEGENDPISSNDTAEGRHENRRTEVKILK